MSRKHSYSAATKRATVRALQEGRRLKAQSGRPRVSSYKMASRVSGGACRQAIHSWESVSLTDQAVKKRLSRRGRRGLLSTEEENLLVGYSVHRRLNLRVLRRAHLVQFATSYFGKTPSPQLISKLLKKHRFSLQKTMVRCSRLVSEKVVDDAVEFLATLRQRNFPPDRIISMDETGLWSNVVSPKTYHFVNWYDSLPSLLLCFLSKNSVLLLLRFPTLSCWSFFFFPHLSSDWKEQRCC